MVKNIRFEEWEEKQMQDPEFRRAVKQYEKRMKYWSWAYDIHAWLDYFLDWIIEKICK